MADMGMTLFADTGGVKKICDAVENYLKERVKYHFDQAKAAIEKLRNMSEGKAIDVVVGVFTALANGVIALVENFLRLINFIIGAMADLFNMEERNATAIQNSAGR